jgi:hypothetical protein
MLAIAGMALLVLIGVGANRLHAQAASATIDPAPNPAFGQNQYDGSVGGPSSMTAQRAIYDAFQPILLDRSLIRPFSGLGRTAVAASPYARHPNRRYRPAGAA